MVVGLRKKEETLAQSSEHKFYWENLLRCVSVYVVKIERDCSPDILIAL